MSTTPGAPNAAPMVLKLGWNPPTDQVEAPLFDWSTTPLAEDYGDAYMKVLDDVFTAEECASLLALAESDGQWIQAEITGSRGSKIDSEYRNSDRILRFDHDAAAKIYQRLEPYAHELLEIRAGDPWAGVIGPKGRVKGTWKLVGLNERLSFLRYGPGTYFREHCDGLLDLPDGRTSRVTIQIYLGEDEVGGGTTRILGRRKRFYDVEPKKGRVLIFQQRGMWHSGEDVTAGLKYTLRSDLMFRQESQDGESKV